MSLAFPVCLASFSFALHVLTKAVLVDPCLVQKINSFLQHSDSDQVPFFSFVALDL